MSLPPDEQPPQTPGLGVPPPGAPTWPPPEAPSTGRGKKIGIAVSVIVVVFIVLGIIGALIGSGADVASYASGKSGVLYTSPSGKYSALFPSKPKTTVQNVPVGQLTLHFTLEMSGDDKDGIAVGFVDYPAAFADFKGADLDRVLTGASNGAAGNVPNGHLANSFFTTLAGHRAIEY